MADNTSLSSLVVPGLLYAISSPLRRLKQNNDELKNKIAERPQSPYEKIVWFGDKSSGENAPNGSKNNAVVQPAPTPTVSPRNVQAVTPPTTAPRSSQTKSRPAQRRKAVAKPVAKKTTTTTVTRTPEQQTAYEQMMAASKNLSAKLHDYANGILPQPTETDERLREIARGYGFLPPEPSVTALQNAADNAVADTLYSQLLQPQAMQYGFKAMPQTAPSVVNGLDELAFELGLQPSLRQGPSLADLYTESQLVNPAVLGINDLLGGVS